VELIRILLAIACEALGAANVRAILLPSPYSTDRTVADAIQLGENLPKPLRYNSYSSGLCFYALLEAVRPIFIEFPFHWPKKIRKARARGNILMAIANKFGYILLNTSNKSELATGYGTLYGDMAGGLDILGDCYKLQVYALARYINRNQEVVPHQLFRSHRVPNSDQVRKIATAFPDYAILDQILSEYMRKEMAPIKLKIRI
jgi:NAD+ synthase (glutamine-hydrolysing)